MFADKPLASKDGVGSILERLMLVPDKLRRKKLPSGDTLGVSEGTCLVGAYFGF
jgi:hypothetical protein